MFIHGKKYLACTVVLLLCVFFLLAGPAWAKKSYRWKIGTLAPKGIGWAKQVEVILLPEVEAATDGNLKLKVYWGGVMGDDEDYLRKIRIDQLQGAGLSGQGAALACPEFAVVELPFLFRNFQEVDFIRDKMTPVFDTYFMRHGLKLAFWIDQDFDQLYSAVSPMASLEDFSKTRFVTWYGPVEEALLHALGADAVPLNVPEIAASMRTRTVNSNIAPAIWMVGAQLYTTVKYVNPVKIRYSPAIITISKKAWDKMPPHYSKRILARRGEIIKRFTTGTRKDNIKSLNAMVDYGVKRTDMTPENYEQVKKQAMTIYPKLAGEVYPVALLQEIQALLGDFRNEKEGSGARVAAVAETKPSAVEEKSPASAWQAPEGEEKTKLLKKIQTNLSKMGYYKGTPDGILGTKTFQAISRFQRDYGMVQSGVIDQELLKFMELQ